MISSARSPRTEISVRAARGEGLRLRLGVVQHLRPAGVGQPALERGVVGPVGLPLHGKRHIIGESLANGMPVYTAQRYLREAEACAEG